MNETIQTIKDLAILTDNSYLLNKINKLEQQIQIALIDAKIEETELLSVSMGVNQFKK
tara:strand:- start:2190 stop:2363 length:174 start_codon:yes stop_codon:yes gene_type:complete